MKYSEKTVELFKNPKNFGEFSKDDQDSVGTGVSGSAACGDVLKLHIKTDENDKIIDARFQTFGCVSAIAASVYIAEKLKGKDLGEALTLSNKEISEELELPPIKLHCSVLAEEAIKNAIDNLKQKRIEQVNEK